MYNTYVYNAYTTLRALFVSALTLISVGPHDDGRHSPMFRVSGMPVNTSIVSFGSIGEGLLE